MSRLPTEADDPAKIAKDTMMYMLRRIQKRVVAGMRITPAEASFLAKSAGLFNAEREVADSGKTTVDASSVDSKELEELVRKMAEGN